MLTCARGSGNCHQNARGLVIAGYMLLKREGIEVNFKKVYLIYW